MIVQQEVGLTEIVVTTQHIKYTTEPFK